MTEHDITDEEIREMGKKELRKEFPSGWMEVSRYETLVLIIDVLLESPTSREFTPGELATESGSTTKSVTSHLDKLVEVGVVEKLDNRNPVRYTLNERSPITQKLFELNTTVQRVKEGDLPESLTSSPRKKIINDHGNRWKNENTKGKSRFNPMRSAAMQ